MSGPSGLKHDYDTLQSDPVQIRLVTIQPGVRPNVIELSLTTHSLNDHPPYEALSYAWGSFDKTPCLVNIDGYHFEVTTNLFSSFYYLRRQGETRAFWIDSICIDQDDTDERSSQVQLMRDIYKSARRAVVWLGDETLWSNRLFQFLKSMDKARGWEVGNEKSKTAFKSSRAELQWRLSTDQHVQRIVERGLYGDIAQRPFWSRIWIVQEVALASDVVVQCGEDEMSWEDFSSGVYILHEVSFLAAAVDNPEIGWLPNVETISIIRDLLRVSSALFLGDVLACLRRSRATDPRDMVYGLLGLLPKPAIQPDYSNASTRDVYIALVEQCIRTERSLDIITLSRRSHSSTTPHLPSWAPDWTETYERGSWEEKALMNEDLPPYPLVVKYFGGEYLGSLTLIDSAEPVLNSAGTLRVLASWSADGDCPPIASTKEISPEATSLTVRGITIGRIAKLGTFTNYDEDDDGRLFFFHALSNWEELMLQRFGLCEDAESGRTVLDVFDRCLQILDDHLISTGTEFTAERESKFRKRDQHRGERERLYKYTKPSCDAGESHSNYRHKLSPCDTVEAFTRTILADLDSDLQRLPSEPSSLNSLFFRPTDASTTSTIPDPKSAPSTSPPVPAPAISPFLPFATNRRFFITSDSHIGLAPIKARIDDHVCVIYGCCVPVVLREAEGGNFTFVGEAYAHGFMDGEAVKGVEEGEVMEREWDIL